MHTNKQATSITITAATQTELPQIKLRLQNANMLWREIDDARVQFFLARRGATVLGFVGLEPDGSYALLRSLFVEPKFRQHGVAAQLLAAVDGYARQHGWRGIFCFSTAAGAYFIKQGYAQVAVATAAQRVGNTPQALHYLQRGDELAEEVAYAKYFSQAQPTNIVVRAAVLADCAPIAAIYAYNVRYGTASWEYAAPGLDEMRQRMYKILDAGYPYLVAEVHGDVLGYAYASSFRPREGYRFTVENSVYVDKFAQRRGVARQLMQTLIARCTQQGFKQMIAVIGDSDNAASIRLHQALGFQHVATFRNIGFKFGRWLDSVQMQLAL